MRLILVVGWASTAVLALRSLRGMRRAWELDRLRDARIKRLEAGFAELGLSGRVAEVHQLRQRDRSHLRGLVAIPAVAFAHLLRPRTAAAVTALALGAGAVGVIHSDAERRSGRVPAYSSRSSGQTDPPRPTDSTSTTVLRLVDLDLAAKPDGLNESTAQTVPATEPALEATAPEPAPITVPPATTTTVDAGVSLLEDECLADVDVLDIEARLACG